MISYFLARRQATCRLCFLFILLLPLNWYASLFAQTADFYSNITEGCNSLTAQFTDNSEGATSWEWDLGNGNTSTLQNPLANYISPGNYTVKLTINGSISTEKVSYIKVFSNPTPDFESDIVSGCAPLLVQFEDKTIPADGEIDSWVWLINGASISEENPSYSFTEVGSYNVTLMAIDEHGCYGNSSKSRFINVGQLPNVDFSILGNAPCELPYHPIIQNTTTIDGVDEPFVYINNWEWKVNDRVVSTEQELDYSFNANGQYNISLAAQMGACTDSLRVENAITLSVGSLDYSIIQEGTGLNDSILFRINNADLYYVQWDLGNGYTSNE